MPKIIGENIDILCNVEARPADNGRQHVAAENHCRVSIATQAGSGSYAAAELLRKSVSRGDTVLIVTGCTHPVEMPFGETDGPLGTAALVRSLYLALGARCIVCAPISCSEPIENTLRAAGCNLRDKTYLFTVPGACGLTSLSEAGEDKRESYSRLLSEHKPKVVIFCGTPKPCGTMGGFTGPSGTQVDVEASTDVSLFLEMCEKNHSETIIIGDACAHDPSLVMPATVTNWGAYGICAMLSYMMRDVDVMHDEKTERRMLAACTKGRCVDASSFLPEQSVGGVTIQSNVAIVTLLRQIVINGMRTIIRIGS